MLESNYILKHRKGLTLLEMVISLAIMIVIMAALLPQIVAINKGWDSRIHSSEALQNGRVLVDHINYNLAKAVRIVDVSEPATVNGFLEFEDNNGDVYRYEVSAGNIVQFGLVGSLSDLAGPVSNFQFTCYTDTDLDTPLTIATDGVDGIRFVKTVITMTNSSALGQDKELVAAAYLRTNKPSLVGMWELDDAAGLTAADSSTIGNDGTLGDMSGNEWTSGVINGALEFVGSNDYIAIAHTDDYLINNGTISLWFNANNVSSRGELLSKDSQYADTGGHLTIYVESSRVNARIQDTSNGYTVSSGSTLQVDTWYHLVLCWGSEGMKLYLNGSLVDTDSYTGGLGTNSGGIGNYEPMALGACTWISGDLVITPLRFFFDGTIDDVRIYNTVLPVEEIIGLNADYSITPGTPFRFENSRTVKDPVLTKINLTHYLCAYDTTSDGWGTVLVVDTDSMTVAVETDYTIAATGGKNPSLNQIDSTHYLYAHSDQAPDDDGWARVLRVNTSTWAITAAAELEYDASYGIDQSIKQIDSTHYLCTYDGPGAEAMAVVLTVDTSDWSVTAGTPSVIDVDSWETVLEKIDTAHYLCAYKSNPGLDKGYARMLEVNTSNWTVSNPASNYRHHNRTSGMLLEKLDDENVLAVMEAISDCAWSFVFYVNTSTGAISHETNRDQLRNDRRGFSLETILSNNYLHAAASTITGIGEASVIEVDPSTYLTSEKAAVVEFGTDVDSLDIEQIDTNNYLCVYTDSSNRGWAIILNVRAIAEEIESDILP